MCAEWSLLFTEVLLQASRLNVITTAARARLIMTTAAAGAAQVPVCQQPQLPCHSTWLRVLIWCVCAHVDCAGGCVVWQPKALTVASSHYMPPPAAALAGAAAVRQQRKLVQQRRCGSSRAVGMRIQLGPSGDSAAVLQHVLMEQASSAGGLCQQRELLCASRGNCFVGEVVEQATARLRLQLSVSAAVAFWCCEAAACGCQAVGGSLLVFKGVARAV